MRYSLRNMPKRWASLRPWFANFSLEITGSRLTSTCETNGQFRFKVRRNGSPGDAQNLQYHTGERLSVEMRCQWSGENAERLTAPFAFVNS
jgi:hypothetical protein